MAGQGVEGEGWGGGGGGVEGEEVGQDGRALVPGCAGYEVGFGGWDGHFGGLWIPPERRGDRKEGNGEQTEYCRSRWIARIRILWVILAV